MKKYCKAFILILFFIALARISATASNDSYVDEIVKAFRKGSSDELGKYFNQTLDLAIPDNEGTYSNTQAEMIMKDFFSKYPPKDFKINNMGSSKTEPEFLIAEYSSSKAVFRVFIMIKSVGRKFYIQQLKIEK